METKRTKRSRTTTLTAIAALAGLAITGATREASALTTYGGAYTCADPAVLGQVVAAVTGSNGAPKGPIAAAAGSPEFDRAAVETTIGAATSMVSRPGASETPAEMTIVRPHAGTAVDVLMCRYRLAAGKTWSNFTAADLRPTGRVAGRLEGAPARYSAAFKAAAPAQESKDSVIALVAAAVESGKTAGFRVSVASHGLKGGGTGGGGTGGGGTHAPPPGANGCPVLTYPSGVQIQTFPDAATTAVYANHLTSAQTAPKCFLDVHNLIDPRSGEPMQSSVHLSKDFTLDDVVQTETAKYGQFVLVNADAIAALQKFHDLAGGQMKLNSGFRSPKHQEDTCQSVCPDHNPLGCTDTCSKYSRHMWGDAFDLPTAFYNTTDTNLACQDGFKFTYLESGTHLHIDQNPAYATCVQQ